MSTLRANDLQSLEDNSIVSIKDIVTDLQFTQDLKNNTNPALGANLVGLYNHSVKDEIDLIKAGLTTKLSGQGPTYLASMNGINVTNAVVDQAPAVNALLATMPMGSTLIIDGPMLRTETPIKIPKEGLTIKGLNRRGTSIRSYGNGAIIESLTKDTVTVKFTNIFDLLLLKDATATGSSFMLDLRSMQFTTVERLWILGAGVAGQIGIRLDALLGTTECSYNSLANINIGGVNDGVSVRDVANSNNMYNIRCQIPVAGGYGFKFAPTVGNYNNNNSMHKCASEYPGQISGGVFIAADVAGVSITACRFESLNTAVFVAVGAGDVVIPYGSNYFSSNSTDFNIQGGSVYRGTGAIARFTGGVTPAISRAVNILSVVRSSAGTYDVTFSKNLGTTYIPLVSSSNPMTAWVSPTGTTLQIRTYNAAGALTDAAFVGLSVEI